MTTSKTEMAFPVMMEQAINKSTSAQHQIATAIGYNNPNIITMFKQGRTRLPLNKVAPMAEYLGEDVSRWMRAWFEAYEPESLTHIERHLGFTISPREKGWVRGLRRVFGDTMPAFNDKMVRNLADAS